MNKTLVLIATLSLLVVVGAGDAAAQSGNGQINVRARNIGIFEFTITDTDFDFGDVDSNGTLSSTGVAGARNGGNNGAVYNADAATTWTCSSAPPRTVRIHNASTTSVVNWGTADRLSVRAPDGTLPGGSTVNPRRFAQRRQRRATIRLTQGPNTAGSRREESFLQATTRPSWTTSSASAMPMTERASRTSRSQ